MRSISRMTLLVAVLATGAHARAQPAATDGATSTASTSPDDAPPEYAPLLEQALTESSAGRWLEARAIFRRAQSLYPNARALRAIGMASYELRDYVAAYAEFSRALSEPRRPLTEAQRTEVEGLLLDIRAFVGRYRLPAVEAGVLLFVDGVETPMPSDRTIVLAPGRHMVELRGTTTLRGEWTVQGGELETLALREVPPESSEPQVILVEAPARRANPRRISGLAMVGASAVSLGVGSAYWARGHRQTARVEDAAAGTPWSSLQGDYEHGPRRERAGLGLVIVGVGLATAGVLIVLHEPERPSARPAVAVGPQRAELRWRW